MTYDEAVAYIHSLLRFGIVPGLERMEKLLHLLGSPEKGRNYIHVAGTNGKGSVSTALSSVLIDAGYRVGLYTSPYVTDFLERIQVCGKPVAKEVFASSVEKVRALCEKMAAEGEYITEFEALTAAAFLCFGAENCDIVVLEVGLGGRLDATNVIETPLVNVITSLSLDHTAVLGDTIEQIAFEKAGTLKTGAAAVIAPGQQKGALGVLHTVAAERHCRLVEPLLSDAAVSKSDLFGTDFSYKGRSYHIKMPGAHQLLNMLCVIEALGVLRKKGFSVPVDAEKSGIARTFLPARTEVLSFEPLVILDGGHNPDGAKAFFNTVKVVPVRGKLTVIAGMMADKDVRDSIAPIARRCDRFIAVTPALNSRAMPAEALAKIAKEYCPAAEYRENAEEAIRKVARTLKKEDALFVIGSLYLAGEVRTPLLKLFPKAVSKE